MTPSSSASSRHWYVGCVRSCQEKKVSESLSRMGVEHYLPLRREIHKWSDRRKVVECLVLPRFIFVRCTDKDRVEILLREQRIWRFLPSEGKAAVVRDEEMETFRRMVQDGPSPVRLSGESLSPGDRVRVIDGPLTGLECELVSIASGRCLAVRLGALGTATMDLDIQTVEKI
ncbi:MAG: UpxY family transcription antiterminator [Bacteroidales bacterium]|nr:UpxY family transcription antiterminator [Bacteroidales bacterium]